LSPSSACLRCSHSESYPKRERRPFWAVFFVFLLFLPVPCTQAYTEGIAADPDEVFLAAKEALSRYGIRMSNPSKRILESRWIEERTHEARSLFKFDYVRSSRRRYRLVVELAGEDGRTLVEIKSTFRKKSTGTGPSIPWKAMKGSAEDRRVEQRLFMQILRVLETRRQKDPGT